MTFMVGDCSSSAANGGVKMGLELRVFLWVRKLPL